MTISEDRVVSSSTPDSWKLNEIFSIGVVLGAYQAVLTVVFFRAMKSTDFFSNTFHVRPLNGNTDEMMSTLYLQKLWIQAFDSVLTVYEGICNLKQVDLKLKICSGSSIGKVLVREVESCSANKLVLGIVSKHHKFKSSAFVATYCAKKLSKLKSLLADSERVKLVKKLSEANQQNRFLKRQLLSEEDALVNFKSELVVVELELQALVALAE